MVTAVHMAFTTAKPPGRAEICVRHMCLLKALTKSLPRRRQAATHPGLSKAAEWAALSEWARRHRLRDWAAHVMTDTRRSADELPQPSPAMLQSTARLSTTWLSGPECNHAPDQWTPRRSQHPQHSRLQHVCTI